jgi:hypothetical protein
MPNAFNAFGLAWDRMVRMLFKPFSMERWFSYGLLCFLQTCAGMGAQNGCAGGNYDAFGDDSNEELKKVLPDLRGDFARAEAWVRANFDLAITIGLVSLLVVVAFVILAQWLGARAAFAYVDDVVHERDDVEAPWRKHAAAASSFWRWRLLYLVAFTVGTLAVALPGIVSVFERISAGETAMDVLSSPSLWAFGIGTALVGGLAALFDLVLYDLALPIQYLRSGTTGAAVREALGLIGKRFGGFLVYLLLKLLFAIGSVLALAVFGIATCCCGFVLLVIPVVGQAIAQPVWVLHRSLSLYYLQQHGPEYDVFAPR